MRRKILLADDMLTVRALSKAVLGDGYDYVEASDGLEAFERARAELPDAVVLDLHMPKHDGVAALRLIRANPSTAAIPVLVITTPGEATRLERSGLLGRGEIIDKSRL